MELSAIALEGLERAQNQLEATARRIAASPAQGDSVDLNAEMIALLATKNAILADLKLAKVVGDIERATIDLLG
jgi:hypothetical protein